MNPTALAAYTRMIELQPNNESWYTERARFYSSQGRYVEAGTASCEKGIALFKRGLVQYLRAGVYENSGQLDKALEDFNRVIQLEPNSAHAVHAAGRFPYFASVLPGGTRGLYQRNLEMGSKRVDVQCQLQFTARSARSSQRRRITKRPSKWPPNAGPVTTRSLSTCAASYRTEQGQYPAAIADYTRVIEHDPTHAVSYMWRYQRLSIFRWLVSGMRSPIVNRRWNRSPRSRAGSAGSRAPAKT